MVRNKKTIICTRIKFEDQWWICKDCKNIHMFCLNDVWTNSLTARPQWVLTFDEGDYLLFSSSLKGHSLPVLGLNVQRRRYTQPGVTGDSAARGAAGRRRWPPPTSLPVVGTVTSERARLKSAYF